MTLQEFEVMVNRHDLTYDYSDDHSCWQRGRISEAKIRDAAKQFPKEDVARIWNAMVDKFLVEDARKPFYWKD